jgi:hypothetical protein
MIEWLRYNSTFVTHNDADYRPLGVVSLSPWSIT